MLIPFSPVTVFIYIRDPQVVLRYSILLVIRKIIFSTGFSEDLSSNISKFIEPLGIPLAQIAVVVPPYMRGQSLPRYDSLRIFSISTQATLLGVFIGCLPSEKRRSYSLLSINTLRCLPVHFPIPPAPLTNQAL